MQKSEKMNPKTIYGNSY